jgi:glycosyltransferase involved in cell wall biosynthesis
MSSSPNSHGIITIIPTYQRPQMLQRAIRSVLDHSSPYHRVCVYDNASSDCTRDVVSALMARDKRVIYHCHEKNIGSQKNFIYGWTHTDSEYVHFLSDDDFVLPGFFERATSALTEHPSAAFFSGGLLQASSDGTVIGRPRYGIEIEHLTSPKAFELLAPYTRTWTSIVYRREMINALGGLSAHIAYSFPVDCTLRAAIRFGAVISDVPCAVFTVHESAISTAEYAEIYRSLLDLSLYESICQAIEDTRAAGHLKDADASAMKTLYQSLMESNLARNAFSFIARNEINLAKHIADTLDEAFGQARLATLIRRAAAANIKGVATRYAIKAIRMGRAFYTASTSRQYRPYTAIVKARMQELTVC